MRRVSLNARMAQDAHATDEVLAVLFHITHPDLDAPIRLSTDTGTEALTIDPLSYGTRSTWMGSNPITEPFLFILAEAVVPSDLDDAPSAAQIVIDNVGSGIAELLCSFTTPATVDVAVIQASTPNVLEAEWQGLQLVSSDINAASVTVSFSREDIEDEPAPLHRMTKERFPGLHR